MATKTKLQKVRGNLFKITLIELIVYLFINPEKIAFFPVLNKVFEWVNKFIIPSGFESDNFIQKFIGGIVDTIYSFELVGVLLDIAIVLIPVAFFFCLIIITPIARLFRKNEVKKRRKNATTYDRSTPSWGYSDMLNIFEKIQHKRDLNRLLDETVFTLIPKNETSIRIQTLIPKNAENGDVMLDWNENKVIVFPEGAPREEADIFCFMRDGEVVVKAFGKYEKVITPNQPFGIADTLYPENIKYVVTLVKGGI